MGTTMSTPTFLLLLPFPLSLPSRPPARTSKYWVRASRKDGDAEGAFRPLRCYVDEREAW